MDIRAMDAGAIDTAADTPAHANVKDGDGVRYTLGPYSPKAELTEGLQTDAANSEGRSPSRANMSTKPEDLIELCLQPDVPPEGNLSTQDIRLLHCAHHPDPFAVLGPHSFLSQGDRCVTFRIWIKDAKTVKLRLKPTCGMMFIGEQEWIELRKCADWLFHASFIWKYVDDRSIQECDLLKLKCPQYELKATYEGDEDQIEYSIHDTYGFGPTVSEDHLKLFQSGSCWHVDNLMGSHSIEFQGTRGIRFVVWAPSARFVSVVGDFNQWDGRAHPMRKHHNFGVWELYIPDTPQFGHKYAYKIHTPAATDVVKIDPYAQEFEDPPAHASIISSDDDAFKPESERYAWGDSEWVEERIKNKETIFRRPMSIYEVHLPSWMRGDNNRYLSYRELAHRLVEHCLKLNFTHVEFLPLAQHPFEGSWGYQVSGLYAPYSRLGKPDDLKYLIDTLHKNGIGVFIDFVPGHFVKDDWGLRHYDGGACYEYSDPREGEHRGWGTMVFNFRRNEVRSFLLGAAYHWLRRYHLDGLRIDAVSSMLYKNYCRDEGDWLPNEYGGDANLEAINMLQELNWVIHHEFPGVFMMAEEATSWKGVTHDQKDNGLGFDSKWDLGWMNDTLGYLCTPSFLRPSKHNKLTFRGLYMGNEKWILPLSHDEVVSGKGSLLDKCGFRGSSFEERISCMKTLLMFQIGSCGRPLLFMGAEFAQGREWNPARSVDWHEAEEPARKKFMQFTADILGTYKNYPALHAGDDQPWNFKWTECDNPESCVISWIRKWMEWHNDVLCVCNWQHQMHKGFPIGVPHGGEWTVIVNSDDWKYGGQMRGLGEGCKISTSPSARPGWPYCLYLDIPPFSGLMLRAPAPKEELLISPSAEPNVEAEVSVEADSKATEPWVPLEAQKAAAAPKKLETSTAEVAGAEDAGEVEKTADTPNAEGDDHHPTAPHF